MFSLEFVANLLGVVSVAVSSAIFVKMKLDEKNSCFSMSADKTF